MSEHIHREKASNKTQLNLNPKYEGKWKKNRNSEI